MIAVTCGYTWKQTEEMRQARDSYRGIPEHAVVSKEVEGARGAYRGMLEYWQPSKEKLDGELKAHRGSFWETLTHRIGTRWQWDSQPYFSAGYWDFLSFMLIGMAMAKWGVLAGAWPGGTYGWVGVAGIGAGATIGAWAANHEAGSGFAPVAAMESYTLYEPVRLLMGLGYMAAIAGVVQAGWLSGVMKALSAVGRMAFSNYILHTLICTTLFYGYGFGWFGKLRRHELYYVVLAIWVLQLIASPLWLRAYRFGPLEWCWRSLTYGKRQPMRIATSEQLLPAENPA
jgi:uncharacterized protein